MPAPAGCLALHPSGIGATNKVTGTQADADPPTRNRRDPAGKTALVFVAVEILTLTVAGQVRVVLIKV